MKQAALVDPTTIKITFDFDWDTVAEVKTIPGRRFNNSNGKPHWTCPLSIDACQILLDSNFSFDWPLVQAFEMIRKPIPKEADVVAAEVGELKKDLFDFQKKGVALIEARNGRALLGDEMGLGKTIQALAWLQMHPDKRPAVIICPAHLKLNWAKEIKDTLPGNQNVQVLFGSPGNNSQLSADIIIVNYDILHKGWDALLDKIKPQVAIIDEAHYIKSNKALRTKATKKLVKKIPHVIALTGTPIVNRPIEAFNIIQILNPTLFPNFWSYVHTYCGAKHTGFGWDFNGATNKEELHQKLVNSIMIRRLKKDVLKDLPDKLYSYVPIQITNNKEYQQAEMDFIEYVRARKGKVAAEKAKGAEHLAKIELLKQLSVKGKMKDAIKWVEDFIEDNGKLVIFTTHKQTIDDLMNVFKDIAVKIDGPVTAQNRQAAVEKFQSDDATRLFIGNIQAAGTGITLTAASAVAFLELPWTSGDLSQAEDRCHRIGQKDSVNVYYLLADNTIEQEIAELLDSKRKVLNAILDGGELEEVNLLTDLMKRYE